MKKIAILFLLLPLLAVAQKPAGWLTPYATTEFKEGKIIYTVSDPRQAMNNNLLPFMYPRNLVQLHTDKRAQQVSGRYIGESQTKKQDEYLRLSAMVLLWDLKLSEFNKEEVHRLKNGEGKTVAWEAGIVLQVLTIFEHK